MGNYTQKPMQKKIINSGKTVEGIAANTGQTALL